MMVLCLGFLNLFAASPVVDPPSAPITLGQWHSDFAKAKAYSEQHDIPMMFLWGAPSCSYCALMDGYIQTTTFKNWQASRQIVMLYIKESYGTPESKWARGVDPYPQQYELLGYPYVAIYWRSKNKLAYNFTGRYSGLNREQQVIDQIESYIGEYSSAELSSVEIKGPATVFENLSFQYTCVAHYSNGQSKTVTTPVTWGDNSDLAAINTSGNLSVSSLASDTDFEVSVSYTEGGITKGDNHPVSARNVVVVGSGSSVNPYIISDSDDFLYMAYNTAAYGQNYKLMSDIDLSGEEFTKAVIAPNIANGLTYSGTSFTGVLDGNGFVVRNVMIKTLSADESFLGLFGKIDGAEVSCLGLENVSITGSSGSRYVGGLFGQIRNSAVSECYVSGAALSGNSYMGAFCGLNSYGSGTRDCFAAGAVSGANFVGGFCGYNYESSTIAKGHAETVVTTGGTAGGFCSFTDGTSSVTGSFWDTTVSGRTTSSGGTGKTTAAMQVEALYTDAGWDFSNTWEMNGYPVLSCFGDAPPPVEPKYSGGAGILVNPYRIANKQDLLVLSTNLVDYDKVFVLTGDIDLAGETFVTAVIAPDIDPSNLEFDGERFTGVFDGAGYVIRNLSILAGGNENDYLGFFGGNDGVIIGLGIEDSVITCGVGSINNGTLCAYNGCGAISECSASGTITGGSDTGGFCGYNEGRIEQSYADVDISGGTNLGGFCARNFCGVINNCYARGSVSGESRIGGFCAENSGLLEQSYAVGTLSAAWGMGGFSYTNQIEDGCGLCGPAGAVYDGAVSNCFWDVETTGTSHGDGATGKTTAEMQMEGTFTGAGWDIGGIWYMNAYPALNVHYKAYSDGAGTAEDPYQIETKKEFLNFAGDTANYNKYFVLIADIDLSGEVFRRAVIAPNGAGAGVTYTGTPFTGTFDGNGHIIRNINIVTSGTNESNLGLFGRLVGGTVTCLGVEGITIADASRTALYVGGFCGQNRDGSVISECYVSGGTLAGAWYVGGFVGVNNVGSSVDNCFTTASVNSFNGFAGGFCGYNMGSSALRKCYSTGVVTGAGTIGGFCAFSDTASVVADCFWNTTTSGLTTSSGGTGKTTVAMQAESTYTAAAWDFVDIWSMDGYPVLLCFCTSSGDCSELIVVNGEGSGTYSNGVEVLISANIPVGYIFTRWSVDPGAFSVNLSNYLDAVTTFVMPDSVVTLTANFLKRPDLTPRYSGAQPNEWTMDYEAALAYAETHDLNTVFLFTGAWWCPHCKYLEQNLLTQPAWQSYLDNNPVMMVMLDFPIRPQILQAYGLPPDYYNNRCFLWDEAYLASNGLSRAEGEARLEINRAFEEEYSVPSVWAQRDYPCVPFPTLVVHRPDGSRAGRITTGDFEDAGVPANAVVEGVIRRLEQAFLSDNPTDEMDDEALMNPPTLDIPMNKSSSTNLYATLSEIDLADNYRLNAIAGQSYIFAFGTNPSYPAAPMEVSILGDDGLTVIDSATFDPSSPTSHRFEGLSTGRYYAKISLVGIQSNLVGYSMSVTRDYPYGGGAGTEENPYLIGCQADFMELAGGTADYAKHFKLTTDIDLTGNIFAGAVIAPNKPAGYDIYSGVPFTGVFDGNGHIIRNINIVTPGAKESHLGLFGLLSGAGCAVRRLGVENITVTDASKTAITIGGFCGKASDGAAISECFVSGGSVAGAWYVGGFIGVNKSGASVDNCFTTASANSFSGYVGGFCGINLINSALRKCYSTGAVTGASPKGGFCASTDGTSVATGCFWNTVTSGQSVSSGGTGKTTAAMQTLTTFTGASWNFDSLWYMDGYPVLAASAPVGSFQRWLSGAAVPVALQGQSSSPAGDGIANLIKYASGLPAMTPATTADLMDISDESTADTFAITFYRSKTETQVNLIPIWASSLAGPWDDTGFTFAQISDDGDRVKWKASIPKDEQGFIRLQATLLE